MAPTDILQLHQWLGRAVFCLGLANIPLGLYVYGSPKSLFVLYAVLVSLFILSWFSLEYLRNRGWFEHRYRNVGGGAVPVPEMSEHHSSDVSHQVPDMESGYSRVGAEDLQVQTPRKSRFSIGKMTWPFNRNSASKRSTENTIGVPYPGLYDGTTSVDTSRAPSAQSPAIGGLAPGPGRRDDVPPVPTLPIQYGQHRSSSSIPSADFQQRYGNPTGLKDTVLRDSTTLGPRPGQHLDMPEPVFSQPSPQYDQYPSQIAPVFGGSPRSSANTQQSSLPRPGQQYNMPVSPISGGGYMEDEHGFIPTPLQEESPRRPLPLPPHRRERSIDSTSRLPTSDVSAETFPSGEGQTILAGGGESSSGRRGQPNVAVQVKLNPDGKSVTVRRLNPEEAEQERRDRSRARQDRARQREIEIERERQLERTSRRSQSRRRQESVDRREEQESRNYEEDRREIQSPGATSYTASVSGVSGQSTTIAGASGGLLGRTTIGPQTPSSEQEPLSAMSPLIGMQPVARSPIPRGIMTSGQRGSTASGTVTAENSEIEQEIVKEQRRKKRREERAGTSQLGPGGSAAGGAAGGGFYGPAGSDSQWT